MSQPARILGIPEPQANGDMIAVFDAALRQGGYEIHLRIRKIENSSRWIDLPEPAEPEPAEETPEEG